MGSDYPLLQTHTAENSFLFCFLQLPFQVSLLTGFAYLHKVPYQMNPILFLVYRFNFALQYAQ